MPDPQAPSGTREKTPSHREIHDYHRARHTGAHPATGVLYISNALAFNTLLSSQETDAHLRGTLVPPPGQLLYFTTEHPSCQLLPRTFQDAADIGILQPPATISVSPASDARPPAGGLLGGSPGRLRRNPARRPSGQEELYDPFIASSNRGHLTSTNPSLPAQNPLDLY